MDTQGHDGQYFGRMSNKHYGPLNSPLRSILKQGPAQKKIGAFGHKEDHATQTRSVKFCQETLLHPVRTGIQDRRRARIREKQTKKLAEIKQGIEQYRVEKEQYRSEKELEHTARLHAEAKIAQYRVEKEQEHAVRLHVEVKIEQYRAEKEQEHTARLHAEVKIEQYRAKILQHRSEKLQADAEITRLHTLLAAQVPPEQGSRKREHDDDELKERVKRHC